MLKRLSLVLISAFAALLLTACGDNAEKKVETKATVNQAQPAPQTMVEPATPVQPMAPATVEPVKPAPAENVKPTPDVSAADINNQESAKNDQIPAAATASANQELANADIQNDNAPNNA